MYPVALELPIRFKSSSTMSMPCGHPIDGGDDVVYPIPFLHLEGVTDDCGSFNELS
jgi:hypothetical protein